ncbi:AAA family ATPase [Aeromonas veronii]|uniref:AAA family ATPase n=1 Tax=Aeromonas veronii TaxID=654 RepID=UPI003D193882
MRVLISEINGILPRTTKDISICLNSKNLIVTGMNGCGKTVFLKKLFDAIVFSIEIHKKARKIYLNEQINNLKSRLQSDNGFYPAGTIALFKNDIERYKKELIDLFNIDDINVSWEEHDLVLDLNEKRSFMVCFYEATRQYTNNIENRPYVKHLNSLSEIRAHGQSQLLDRDFSENFEAYIVAFFEAGYMASLMRNDPAEKLKVDSWLSAVKDDLRHLFEDDSLSLVYNEQERCFYIEQAGKAPYTFAKLSSGYSSILKIYTDLLMKVELYGINKNDLTGIVIIDEIDAHLHISLQRKILSFLSRSYPNVQFIVSTHSPFVIQSVDDAVIYDLSKLERLEDLSLYSYSAIVKGLLGVDTNSEFLLGITGELSSLLSDVALNKTRILGLIEQLSPIETELDSKSRTILLMAKQAIEDIEGL